MSDPLFAPPSIAAIFLVFLLCGLLTFLDEDGCPPALPVALLVVHVLEAALLLVVVVVVVELVQVGVGTEVLVGVVVDVMVGVTLLSISSLSASAPNKDVWGLPGSKSSADGITTVPSAALSRRGAGVDAGRVPRMASISS